MSLWRILATASFIIAISFNAFADIYVYEVVTETKRFQTASKMPPRTFIKYYGGTDVIYELIIVDTIKGDNFDAAANKYKLGNNNYRDLSPKAANPNYDFNRFIWWR